MKHPDIPTQIVRAREAAGLSQAQLAAKMGVEQPWICNVEGGRRRPNIAHLQAFSRVLGCVFTIGPNAWPEDGAS